MGLVKWLQGSTSENYRRVEWFSTDIDPALMEGWPSFKGDKQVLEYRGIWVPRTARMAGIVAVDKSVMQELRDNTPDAQDGVATGALGKVWAGVLPKGVQFAEFALHGQGYELVAGRLGNGAMHLLPVRINPDTGEVTLPTFTKSQVSERGPVEFVPRLPDIYMDVPVV